MVRTRMVQRVMRMVRDPRLKKVSPMERLLGWGIIRSARSVESIQKSKFGGFRQKPKK